MYHLACHVLIAIFTSLIPVDKSTLQIWIILFWIKLTKPKNILFQEKAIFFIILIIGNRNRSFMDRELDAIGRLDWRLRRRSVT